jgi:hypothetical protein
VLHTPPLAAPDFAVLDEVAAEEVVLAEATDPALVVAGVPAPDDPDLLLMEEAAPVDAGCVLADATGAVDPALLFVELTTTAGVELAAGTELTAAPAYLVHNPTAAALFASSTE